jgi:hypothetical protein
MPQLTTGKGKEAMEDPVDPQLIQDVIQPDGMIDPPRRIMGRTPRKVERRNTEYVRNRPLPTNNYATLPESAEGGPSQLPGQNHDRCKQPGPPHCPLAVVNMLSTVVIIKRCPGMWF